MEVGFTFYLLQTTKKERRHLHLVELGVLPLVHGDRAHEGEVDAEAAVLSAALQADPDAVGHGNPLRVVGAAFEAPLKGE